MPKKTFKSVKKSWNDAVIQLKWNQKRLKENCEKIVLEWKINWELKTENKWRNRIETRIIKKYKFEKIDKNLSEEWWENIDEIVLVERFIKRKNTKTKKYEDSYEKSFYLSTKVLDTKEYAQIIRLHWAIENKNHYVKDVSFNEDRSRIRVNADIFVILRSFALNIMRAKNSKNIKNDLYTNSLNLNIFLKKYIDFL